MEIHPSNKDILWLHFLELSQFFAILEQAIDFGDIGQLDRVHSDEADELPQDTEHEVCGLVEEALSVNADDFNHGFGSG